MTDEYFFKCETCGREISSEFLKRENRRRRELNQMEAIFVNCNLPPEDPTRALHSSHFSPVMVLNFVKKDFTAALVAASGRQVLYEKESDGSYSLIGPLVEGEFIDV